MRVGKIYTWGNPTAYIREIPEEEKKVRVFIKLSIFVYGAWILYMVHNEESYQIARGEHEIFWYPIYKQPQSYQSSWLLG